jgi:hypothetical protein
MSLVVICFRFQALCFLNIFIDFPKKRFLQMLCKFFKQTNGPTEKDGCLLTSQMLPGAKLRRLTSRQRATSLTPSPALA